MGFFVLDWNMLYYFKTEQLKEKYLKTQTQSEEFQQLLIFGE